MDLYEQNLIEIYYEEEAFFEIFYDEYIEFKESNKEYYIKLDKQYEDDGYELSFDYDNEDQIILRIKNKKIDLLYEEKTRERN